MNRFWKIYFWIYLVTMAVVVIYYIHTGILNKLTPEYLNNAFVQVLGYIIMFIPIVGIHGLAYRRRYLHHIFWKAYFLVYMYSVLNNFILKEIEGYSISILIPFQIITLIGLFIYSYRQNTLFLHKQRGHL